MVDVNAQSLTIKPVNLHTYLNSLRQVAVEYLRVLTASMANIGFLNLILVPLIWVHVASSNKPDASDFNNISI